MASLFYLVRKQGLEHSKSDTPVAPMYKYITVLTPSKWYFLDINELKMYNNVKNIINLKEMLLWVLRA